MPDDVKICRICVRKDVTLYEHDRYQLMAYYKEVTGFEVSKNDCLPKWFCFECAALLYKFHVFKRKCHKGQNFFKKLSSRGCKNVDTDKLTVPRMTTIEPYLQILSISKNKKVKTFTVQHNETQKNKIHHKNKYKSFTKVFVDDIKLDAETSERNSKLTVNKALRKILTAKSSAEGNNQKLYVDFNNDDDFSDIPLVIQEPVSHVVENVDFDNKNFIDEQDVSYTKITEVTNDISAVSDIDKNACYDTDRTSLEVNDKLKNTDSEKRINNDYDRASDIETDFIQNNTEKNLDNKFQRSVKKKFLDENHWTKITLSDEEASRRFKAKALEQKYLKAEFKCVDCYRTFSQEDMMKRHIKLRHCESLGPNECRHCRMRFKWKSRLQKHLKEHYTIYKCLRCELSFPVEITAFQHDYSHNGVIWTCAQCGQRFRHSSTYYTHLRKHKSKFVCTLCGVSFVSEFGLFMHKRVKHVIVEDSKEESLNTYCKVCDIKFDNSKGYDEHFTESALHATEVLEGATSLPLKTRCTKKRVPRITTNCTSCGKTFSTYAAFCKHHLSAHPELVLPKSRTDKQDGQKQICEVCGHTLASAWSLMNHLNTHSRDRRYTCKTCGMQLSSRSFLQRHQMAHSNGKIFVCDVCDKRFAHRSGLRLHLRTHDKDLTNRTRKKKTETPNVMEYFKSYGTIAHNYR